MSAQYVIAIDAGTTSTRAILYNRRCNSVCSSKKNENLPLHPHAGWAEHDPMLLLGNAKLSIEQCLAEAKKLSIKPSQIKAVGITNQRETTVVWDRNTGSPLYNAIIWHDARTVSTMETLRKKFKSEQVRSISGLPISTYFSGVKLRWMIDNVPEVATAIEEGTALFGTVDTWLVWNLSMEKSHVTDVTNAGRTMMMDIRSLSWDPTLVDLIGVSTDILPEILPCSAEFGHMADTALKGTVISGVIGDQQSALVGQACFETGEAKNTYGTGCFLIVNSGTKPKFTNSYLLTTPAYQFESNPDSCVYSLEGSIAVAGAAITWLRDNLGIIRNAPEVEDLAMSVPDTDDVYVVPAFSGFLAPYWREDARGTIVGITQRTTRAHIARATLESMAYKTQKVLEASEKDMGVPLRQLRVDGGAAVNDLLMQMQADIVGTEVLRPSDVETTAMGAAFAAGYFIRLYESLDEFRESRTVGKKFIPMITEEERERKISRWNDAVERSLGWVLDPRPKPLIWIPPPSVVAAFAVGAAVGATAMALLCRYKKA